MSLFFFFSILCRPPSSTLFPYTTLFRSERLVSGHRRAASIRFTRRRVGRSHGSLRHGEAPAFRKRFDDTAEVELKIGFIGLGTMGQHMARHVVEADHEVSVHDLRREAAADHEANGPVWADS